MTFAKIDDNFLGHTKAKRARKLGGSEAIDLWLAIRLYCGRELTDGFIPEDMVSSCGGPEHPRTVRKALDALCKAGLLEWVSGPSAQQVGEQEPSKCSGSADQVPSKWGSKSLPSAVGQRTKCSGSADQVQWVSGPSAQQVGEQEPSKCHPCAGYQMHDYLDWASSREDVLRIRSEESAKKRRLRKNVPPGLPEQTTKGLPRPPNEGLRLSRAQSETETETETETKGGESAHKREESTPPAQLPHIRSFERAFQSTIESWSGWTLKQAARLREAKKDPEILRDKFRAHHKSRGTRSSDWEAEAEKWVLGDEDRSRTTTSKPAIEDELGGRTIS